MAIYGLLIDGHRLKNGDDYLKGRGIGGPGFNTSPLRRVAVNKAVAAVITTVGGLSFIHSIARQGRIIIQR